MTAISLPSCFGEPLGDVMHLMRMCGNYRYPTTRYSYSPKREMFLLLLNLLLFSNCIILIPCHKQYFCRKKLHTLANALKSMENTSLEKSLNTFAVACHSFLESLSH